MIRTLWDAIGSVVPLAVRSWGEAISDAMDDAPSSEDVDAKADQAAFANHSARHEDGGADALNVGGLSGVLADPQTPAAHDNSAHSTDFATEAALGDATDLLAQAAVIVDAVGADATPRVAGLGGHIWLRGDGEGAPNNIADGDVVLEEVDES